MIDRDVHYGCRPDNAQVPSMYICQHTCTGHFTLADACLVPVHSSGIYLWSSVVYNLLVAMVHHGFTTSHIRTFTGCRQLASDGHWTTEDCLSVGCCIVSVRGNGDLSAFRCTFVMGVFMVYVCREMVR